MPLHDPSATRRVGSAGRPELFRPEYCDLAESLGAQGKSPAQIAAVIRISKATLYRWAQECEDFKTALSRAKTAEQAYWEALGQKALNRKHFQAQVWRTSMAARFKDDYTETKGAVEVTLNLNDILAQPMPISATVEKLEPPKS